MDKLTNKQTNKQTDRQTDKQTNKQANKQTNKQTIRLRSQIWRKHDLEIEGICCANGRFLSKMTPRLRAESTGVSMTLLGR